MEPITDECPNCGAPPPHTIIGGEEFQHPEPNAPATTRVRKLKCQVCGKEWRLFEPLRERGQLDHPPDEAEI